MKNKYTRKQIQEAIKYWTSKLEMMNEAWGPKPHVEERKYQEDGFNFIVRVTSGKRRPSPNERAMYHSSDWITYKARRIYWVDDSTKQFSGRLYNDFGNIVLEPDFDGLDEFTWAEKAGISKEDLGRFLDAAEEVLKKSKKEF